MVLDPIQDVGRTLADEAHEAIVLAILSQRIELGSRLIMDELANSLNISRTPVRDALQKLELEGVVEQRGRRGFIVRSISADDVRMLYQAREAVECFAARWVAEHAPASFFDTLREQIALAQHTLDGTVLQSYLANRLIHRRIVEAVGNRHLTQNFDSVWGASVAAVAYGNLFLRDVGMQEQDVQADHQDLVDVLESADPLKAGEAMEAHINEGLEINLSAPTDSDDPISE